MEGQYPLMQRVLWRSGLSLALANRSRREDLKLATFVAAWVLLLFLFAPACGPSAFKGTILFTSHRQGGLGVYSVSSRGGELKHLTPGDTYAFSPRWSPDYTRFLYLARRGEKTALMVANRDGSHPQGLAETDGILANPRWSADGRYIAYALTLDGATAIRVMRSDGTGDAPVAFEVSPADYASWSSDSQWLAVASATPGSPGIYLRNPAGVNYHRLSAQQDSLPLWSPKGDRIAFMSERDGTSEVYVMRSDGSQQARLTTNETREYHLAWSPDGGSLAYVSEEDGNPEIYVARVDGSQTLRLTFNAFPEMDPTWSPDGRRIVFVSSREGNADLFIMDADGNRQQNLTSSPAPEFSPSWSAR
ncbi:MAG: PD40 domain-containing protein [Chloroflexi bacterium]|nr:PD40 domain-containing protein [Chloroflexota bacterium]